MTTCKPVPIIAALEVVVKAEALDLVTITDIARLCGVSRQAVHAWCNKPTFPQPYTRIGRTRVWEWKTIQEWKAS